jgi:hypothetical protein
MKIRAPAEDEPCAEDIMDIDDSGEDSSLPLTDVVAKVMNAKSVAILESGDGDVSNSDNDEAIGFDEGPGSDFNRRHSTADWLRWDN